MIGEIVYHYLTHPTEKVDLVYMFSNTANFDKDNYDWLDERAILEADPMNVNKTIDNLLSIQKATKFKRRILVIFDDIDLTSQYAGINLLAVRGRHYKITTILSAQIATQAISPSIRNNITYLFFRKLTAKVIKDQIYSMVHTFENPNELYKYVQANNKEYRFLFYDNDSDNEELKIVKAEKKQFQYKLPKPKGPKWDRTRKRGEIHPVPTGNYYNKYNINVEI